MENNRNFKFNVSVSTTRYEGKCNEWGKLRYRTEAVTIDGMSNYIKQGYCFTHTFKEVDADGSFGCKQKTIKNFKSTNTIFIDVDDSSVTATDFFSSVTPQPTILYSTPSNIDGEKNRFRLVYVYGEEVTDNDTYRQEVKKICSSIAEYIPDFKYDTTSVNVSQQMGGNGSGGCTLLMTHNIFNLLSFKNYNNCISNTYKKEERNDIINRNAVSYEEKDIEIKDKEFERRFWEIDSEDGAYQLLTDYQYKYEITDTTQVDENIPYISLDDYVQISRRFFMEKIDDGKYIPRNVRIKRGDRERTLFNNALLRLKINPNMTFENLLFAMVYERQFWIDNSDGEFTNKILYKIAKGAYTKRDRYSIASATKGQLRRRARTNKNGIKVNKAYCEKYGVGVRAMANHIRSGISNEILLENYDFERSVADNSKLLKEKGIKPNSERRLYEFKKWCKKNNINIK